MNRHQTQKSSSNAEGASTSGTLSNSDGAADGQPCHAEHIRYTQCKLREADTLDILSGGRLEFGLGAGYDQSENEAWS